MKILAIRGKNLASLEGEFNVDFTQEPLLSAGIFAITGPTGAGKSTLLDALCLALFANTPRLSTPSAKEQGVQLHDGTSQNDIRNILRKGSIEAYAEVDFTAQDGKDYRSRWTVRRARGKTDGALQADVVELTHLQTHDKFGDRKTGTLKRIEQLIGLSFEQFTRTVLLAQNDFTAFLKADKGAKADILEKLTGTEIYSKISILIFEKHKAAYQSLLQLRLQIKDIALLELAEVNRLQLRKEIASVEITQLIQDKTLLEKEISWHEQSEKLHLGTEEARKALQEATVLFEAGSDRIKQLQLIEQIQPLRALVQARETTKVSLEQKEKELSQIETQLHLLIQEKEEAKKVQENATKALANAQEATVHAKPLLAEASKLDVLIENAERQELTLVAEIKNAFEGNQKLILAKNQLLKQENVLSEELLKLTNWQEAHRNRQPIAENVAVIASKLQDAFYMLKQQLSIKELVISLNKWLLAQQDKVSNANTLFFLKQEELVQQQQFLTDQKENLTVFTNHTDDKVQLRTRLETLRKEYAIWQSLYSNQKLQKEQAKEFSFLTDALASITTQLATDLVLLQNAESAWKQSQKMYQASLLATSGNTEQMRAQLQANEPCPVCGSKEHPYRNSGHQLHDVLQTLESLSGDSERKYKELLDLTNEARKREFGHQQHLQLIQQESALLKPQVDEQMKEWMSRPISKELASMPEENRSNWLEKEIEDLVQKNANYEQQELKYATIQNTVQQAQEKVTVLLSANRSAEEEVRQLTGEIRLKEQEMEQLKQTLRTLGDSLNDIIQFVNEYFENKDWHAKWQASPDTFLDSVKKFATAWKENTDKQNSLSQQLIRLKNELALQILQSEQAENALNKLKSKLDETRLEKSASLQKRKLFFEGKAVLVVEEQLGKAEQLSKQLYEKAREKSDHVNLALSSKSSAADILSTAIQDYKLRFSKNYAAVEDWIFTFNKSYQITIDQNVIEQSLSYTADWINTQKKEIQEIELAFKKAETIFGERLQNANQHDESRLSHRNKDELLGLLQVILKALETLQNESNEISYLLRIDSTNRSRAAKLLEDIEKQTVVQEQWKKLEELIGSSDGKKFRQIAQEYTLEMLLGYANRHLRELAKRYRLERVSDSLALHIIDEDMGDEMRSVHSLSGGESFLVSLALALGLSSLSSNRMSVQSLFIDEGFGSLDAETLRVAMDALEQLHAQGRKVGVISHVQEMTERIPVQIQVIKVAAGKSKVMIAGN